MCEIQIRVVRGSSTRGAAESFIDVEGTASDCTSGMVVIRITFGDHQVTSRSQLSRDGEWSARIRARSWCDELITVDAYCEGHQECAADPIQGTIVCPEPPRPEPPLGR